MISVAAFPAMGLRLLLRCVARRLPAYRIALVGNGPIAPSMVAEIDGHDLVVRFNRCAHYGATGYRTDILALINTGEPSEQFASDEHQINPDALASARSFLLPKAPEIVEAERARCPEDASCWMTCDEDIVRKLFCGRPWNYIPADTYREARRRLDANGARSTDHPSTGILVLFHISRSFGWFRPVKVTLYGFTHEGWDRHPWTAERAIIDGWQDWVTRAPMSWRC